MVRTCDNINMKLSCSKGRGYLHRIIHEMILHSGHGIWNHSILSYVS